MKQREAYEVDPSDVRPHRLATVFPRLRGAARRRFVASIHDRGQIVAAVVHEGRILDGVNRWRACKTLGQPLRVIDWDGVGGSEIDFVVAANVDRRHASAAQRAMIAVDLLPHYQRAAKERQREAGRKRGRGQKSEADEKLEPMSAQPTEGQPSKRVPQARDRVAALMHVGKTSVAEAKAIKTRAPDVAKLVKSGALRLPVAKALADVDAPARAEIIKRAQAEGLAYADALKTWSRRRTKAAARTATAQTAPHARSLAGLLSKATSHATKLCDALGHAEVTAAALGGVPDDVDLRELRKLVANAKRLVRGLCASSD